jgi:hypothetical protein
MARHALVRRNDGKPWLGFDANWPNIFMHVSAPPSRIGLVFFYRRGVSVCRFAVRAILFDEAEKDQLFIIDSNTDYGLTKMITVWMHKTNSPVLTFQRALPSSI